MASPKSKTLGIVKEITYGVIPTSPVFKSISCNKDTSLMNAEFNSVESQNTKSGRGTDGSVVVGGSATGAIEADFSHSILESGLVESAMWNDWVLQGRSIITADANLATIQVADETQFAIDDIVGSHGSKGIVTTTAVGSVTVDIALTNAIDGDDLVVVGKKITGVDIVSSTLVSTGVFDFTTLNLVAGQYVKLAGFSTTQNNAWVRVVSVTATTIVIDVVPTGWADEVVVGDIELYFGETIKDGVKKNSFSTMEYYSDMSTPSYKYSTGHIANTLNIELPSQDLVKVSISTLGKEIIATTTAVAGQIQSPAYSSSVANTTNNIARLVVDGVDINDDLVITSMSLEINNNIESLNAVGKFYSALVNAGNFNVTGTISALFDDIAILDKIKNNTDFGVSIINANKGQAFVMDLPAMNVTSAPETVENQTIIVGQEVSAKESGVFGHTLMMQRFEAFA